MKWRAWAISIAVPVLGCTDRIADPNPARGPELERLFAPEPVSEGGVRDRDDIPPGPTVVDSACKESCCPTNPACFGSGPTGPGAECLAMRDNSRQGRLQFRQAWVRSFLPLGNDNALIGTVLLQRSELPWSVCNLKGLGGYVQLLDLDLRDADLENHVSRLGYARFVGEDGIEAAARDGMCMVSTTYDKLERRLPSDQMSPSDGYPEGLPPPMPLPWTVAPVQARRVRDEFDVVTQREALLSAIAADPDGYNGIFYYDEESGYVHGYAPLAWVVIYDKPEEFFAVPIREAETFTQLNDPEHPNCAGVYRGAEPSAECSATVKEDPAWGCAAGGCEPGRGPSLTTGYFLITEVEQVETVLRSTLCTDFQTQEAAAAAGWSGAWGQNCRGSPQWNPSDPVRGLPRGDWCAKRNGPASDDCHDAFRNRTYHVYSAFPVKDGTCAAVGSP